jgi:hypothetical protein
MAVAASFVPTSHEVPSASRRRTRLLPCCCVCGLIRDETRPAHYPQRWITQGMYRNLHGVEPSNCLLTHTYCPECFIQARHGIRAAWGPAQ